MSQIPSQRLRRVNDAPLSPVADYVLYWMIASRRTRFNFGLERAVELARELGKPLLVLEALRCGYRWASDRLHGFVIDGMADNARRLASTPVGYHPYLEPEPGAGKGLLEALASRAAAVVTDHFPCFFLPRMVEAAGGRLGVRLETVDSNGLLPLRAAPQVFARAFTFRRFLQRELPRHLGEPPREDPLAGARLPAFGELPREILRRWPAADLDALARSGSLAAFPIDHEVPRAPVRGGSAAGEKALHRFVAERLGRYGEDRNHPDLDGTSGLSPHLHFGHLSAHEIFAAVAARERWGPHQLARSASGAREGWWGMGASAESFLDQTVTWRELGYNMAWQREDFDRYESLPAWAQVTLAEHASDPREHLYTLEDFERAATHDPLWNAVQNQLREEGRVHGYLRMLWGKKILHWSPGPREALEVMAALNDKYALDGRNPNSTSGIFWCLGRYDRAWGPERPIFGKVRYMTSDSARRKLRLEGYLRRYGSHR